MAKTSLLSFLFPFLLVAFVLNCHCHEDDKKVHIVYMGHRPSGDISVASTHHAMLSDVLGSISSAKESLLYSYGRSFNGFAAKLSDKEVARLYKMEGVVSVFPSKKLQLHTTRSWDFMGLTQDRVGGPAEGDVIVGLLDTGIWPEIESFGDEGLGPPPAKWKGTCMNDNFTCNNKVIGARYYNAANLYKRGDIKSPRDTEGHGSHTASTAAGRVVPGASYFGLAEGVARGGVPKARIAVYKVCWSTGCYDADILAAFDDAIADGVDIVSVSLGSYGPLEFFEDAIAIGSFHAMKNGILTANSAGNSGPFARSVANYSPWSITVAASSLDRSFVSKVVLGNGQVFLGNAINSFDLNGTTYPLVWGGDAYNITAGMNSVFSRVCFPGTLGPKATGKIVLCDGINDELGTNIVGAVGTIMSFPYIDMSLSFPQPTTIISWDDRIKALNYIRTTENPIATILVAETPVDVNAPKVVSFSSRGPSPISPDILKPDLTAPGANILAGWSPAVPPSISIFDQRQSHFNIISGTSMSCPHVAGAAAYIKSIHPTWSPAAIKSALMTTAMKMDPRKNDDQEFSYGSGHINPVKALSPGLVFNASEADYVDFLCKQGYNASSIALITGDSSACSNSQPGKPWGLNYPSFAISVQDGDQVMGIFTRTVTNVGFANCTYYSKVEVPSFLSVTVEPTVLTFSTTGAKQTFTVKVYGPKIEQERVISGSIVWSDGVHEVRTPLAITTVGRYSFLDENSTNPTSFYGATENLGSFEAPSIYHKNGIFRSN